MASTPTLGKPFNVGLGIVRGLSTKLLCYGRIFMERLLCYMYHLQWPVDEQGSIQRVGQVSFTELFVDFVLSTSTMVPVPFAKGWATEDQEKKAKLVHRTLHQHSLVVHYAINILAKHGAMYKVPGTVQTPVMVVLGAKLNTFGLDSRPRLVKPDKVKQALLNYFGHYHHGNLKLPWTTRGDGFPSFALPDQDNKEVSKHDLWSCQGCAPFTVERLQVAVRKKKAPSNLPQGTQGQQLLELQHLAKAELAKQVLGTKIQKNAAVVPTALNGFSCDEWLVKGRQTRPLSISEQNVLKIHGRLLQHEFHRSCFSKMQGCHVFAMLPCAQRYACIFRTVTATVANVPRLRDQRCEGVAHIVAHDSLPEEVAEKTLVGAPARAARRRERFRIWSNGVTDNCKGCDDTISVKLHNKICMAKQKLFDAHERESGHPEARASTSHYGRPCGR